MNLFSIVGGSSKAGTASHADTSLPSASTAVRRLDEDETPRETKHADQRFWSTCDHEIGPKPPKVVYIRDHESADTELALLDSHLGVDGIQAVGFDIEWRPREHHLPENRVALVQIATGTKILLLQLSAMSRFPDSLARFLTDKNIMKTGVGILGDAQRMYRDYDVAMHSCTELSYLARTLDNERWSGPPTDLISLARLVHEYTGSLLPKNKNLQKSNWEGVLTKEQMHYAANDAFASREVGADLLIRARHLDPSLFSFDVVRASPVDANGQPWSLRITPPLPPVQSSWSISTRTGLTAPVPPPHSPKEDKINKDKDEPKASTPGATRPKACDTYIYRPSYLRRQQPYKPPLRSNRSSGGTRKPSLGLKYVDEVGPLGFSDSVPKRKDEHWYGNAKIDSPYLDSDSDTEIDPFGWGTVPAPSKDKYRK